MCRTVMVVAIMMAVVWRLWFVAGALALVHIAVMRGLTVVAGALALVHIAVMRGLTIVAGALTVAHVAIVGRLLRTVVAWAYITSVGGLLCIGFFLVVDAVAIIVVTAWLFALLAISRLVVTALCLLGSATVAATTAILSLDSGGGQDSANKCDGQSS